MIPERLKQLRALMAERGIDAYYLSTADFHQSEYVGDYFKARRFMTGFTGSAGNAIITPQEAGLWTDGRYFVQAAKQLEGTTVVLHKSGQEGVPTIMEYLDSVLKEGSKLAFDGRVVDAKTGKKFSEAFADRHIQISCDEDLVDMIWEDRPELSKQPVFILDTKYAGESAEDKIAKLRSEMKKKGADSHVMTTLDDIAWLLNIRGNDVLYNPMVLSYVVVEQDKLYLFIQSEVLSDEVKAYLDKIGVTIMPYNDIYRFIKEMRNISVLAESAKINYAIYSSFDASVTLIDAMNPTSLMKAMKNLVEVENMKKAHIKDGVAVTKFIYWMKKNVGKIPMDEISVSDYLEELRKKQEDFLEPSFGTISAYKENAAMCHYSATKESNKVIEPKGLYLVDSGGQYLDGTTDITRTIAVGPLTKEEKMHFTLVAVSMLNLGNVQFMYGCCGMNLDYTARAPFWERGLDFNHGTGHGVGFLSGVHERPNGIRWRIVPERQDSWPLEEGMICSDEPGLYIEGSHGIRTENLILCKKSVKNEYGQFMKFEYLTFVPIDLDAIDTQYMSEKEVGLLNAYHKEVYDKISPYLEPEEKEWLKEYTRPVEK